MRKVNYEHPQYRAIESKVRDQLDHDFNQITVDVVRAYLGNTNNHQDFISRDINEQIQQPSFHVMAGEWLYDQDRESIVREYADDLGIGEQIPDSVDLSTGPLTDEFIDWLDINYEGEINDYFHESEHYPMWNTMFEARDSWLNDWISDHVDELYELGIGVIEGEGDLNHMLFFSGCGYDFYEAHWIPLYIARGYTPVIDLIGEEGINDNSIQTRG